MYFPFNIILIRIYAKISLIILNFSFIFLSILKINFNHDFFYLENSENLMYAPGPGLIVGSAICLREE